MAALEALVRKTGIHFLHLKNLCIDPPLYEGNMPGPSGGGMGMKQMTDLLGETFPDLELGYFNQPAAGRKQKPHLLEKDRSTL
jgi:hypothetical protein